MIFDSNKKNPNPNYELLEFGILKFWNLIFYLAMFTALVSLITVTFT